MKKIIYFLSLIVFVSACNTPKEQHVFFRLNQVGYLLDDPKIGVLLSPKELPDLTFEVINLKNKDTQTFKMKYSGQYGNFPFCYQLDFSDI